MDRRSFLAGLGSVGWAFSGLPMRAADRRNHALSTTILIVGGGVGGVAAALAACRAGHRVVLTEETLWLGGQLTSQAVPPDEHPWIEESGCTRSYREFRDTVRSRFIQEFPVTAATAGWSAGRRAGSGAFIGEMGGSGGLQGPALCVVRRLRAVEAGAGEGSKAEQGPAEEVQRLQAQLCERCVALLVAEKAVCSRHFQ